MAKFGKIFDPVNFEDVTKEFIRFVRGSVTGESLSHDLGFDFNVVSRWESGRRGFYWNDFLSLAKLKRWNVSKALEITTHFEFSNCPEAHEVLGHLLLPSSRKILMPHYSGQRLNRIASGRSKLLFSEFLSVLERLYGRAERFLNQFTEDQGALATFFSISDRYQEFTSKDPLLNILCMATSLKQYKSLPSHSDAFLARFLNMTQGEVAKKIQVLVKLGALRKNGSLFEARPGLFDSGAVNREYSRDISRYWKKQILASSEKKQGGNQDLLSAYLIFATNPEIDSQVFELCRKFYIDLKNLTSVEGSLNAENLRFIGIDLLYPLGKLLPHAMDD